MKNPLASLALLVLLGCGSSDPGAAASPAGGSSVQGTWIDVVDATSALEFTFTTSTWAERFFAQLADGSFGVEVDSGTYTASAGTLALTLTASSCSGLSKKTKSATYVRNGNSLQLTIGTVLLAFQASTSAPSGMGVATVGCTDSTGLFSAHAVVPLP